MRKDFQNNKANDKSETELQVI